MKSRRGTTSGSNNSNNNNNSNNSNSSSNNSKATQPATVAPFGLFGSSGNISDSLDDEKALSGLAASSTATATTTTTAAATAATATTITAAGATTTPATTATAATTTTGGGAATVIGATAAAAAFAAISASKVVGHGAGNNGGPGGGGVTTGIAGVQQAPQDEFASVDIREQCPKFAALVDSRSGKISLENVDPLQLELETLLVAVVQRKQQLRAQLEALDHDDSAGSRDGSGRSDKDFSRGDKHRASSPLQGGGSQSKRARSYASTNEHRVSKKGSKEKSGKSSGSTFGIDIIKDSLNGQDSSVGGGGPASKLAKGPKGPGGQTPAGKAGSTPLTSNDAPHRFWAYIDEYCRPASDEHIQALENILEAQEAIKFSDYVKVPPLGTHYIVKWAQEDLLEEQLEAAPHASTAGFMEDMEKVLHQTAKESLSDERYGTLTQRLMSCLIEENVIRRSSGDDLPVVLSHTKTTPALNVAAIEQRIRTELEELGVMQALAEKVAEQDDEVFLELRKCQSQLLSISAQNVRLLRGLLETARKRRAEHALEERLRAIDQEMLEHFRRRKATARSSRTSSMILIPPTKQDKEQMRALLVERKTIIDKLNTTRVSIKSEPA